MIADRYSYTIKSGRNFPLSNKLVIASRELSTIGDVNLFCAPPFFPHLRLGGHKAYWEPIGDQAKPLFIRWKYKGRELRYHLPESTVTPYLVTSKTKWADTSGWWHPEGLLLDSVCFCPTGHAGYLLKLVLKNVAAIPFDITFVLGGSHQKAEGRIDDPAGMVRQFSGAALAIAVDGFRLRPSSFEDIARRGVALHTDLRVGEDFGYYLAEETVTIPGNGVREIVAGELIAFEKTSPERLLADLHRLLERVDEHLVQTQQAWEEELANAPKLECPDDNVRQMWDWAWVNLELLSRENSNCSWLPGVEYTTLLALPLIYCWDHLYTTMVQNFHKPGVSRRVLVEFLRHQTDDGFIPGEIDSAGKNGHMFTQCHALYALAMWNYICISGDCAILDEMVNGKTAYERLVLAFDWYAHGGTCITCFKDGVILNEFTTPTINFCHKADGLVWTTGLGDTGWDTADYRGYNNEWVDLNTYLYQGLCAMGEIAVLKGDERRSKTYSAWASKVKASINRLMWDPQGRFYFDLDPGHNRMDVITAGGLLPILTDIPDAAQVEGILSRLLDPAHFWRPYGIPCLSFSHPRYNPRQYFWLGSCPPQIENTIILGLYNHGRSDLGYEIWQKLLRAYQKSDGGPRYFCETYDADSGEGQWSENYNWTSMMILPLLLGIVGLEATPQRVAFNPRLPAGWEYMRLTNVWIHGKPCELEVRPESVKVISDIKETG